MHFSRLIGICPIDFISQRFKGFSRLIGIYPIDLISPRCKGFSRLIGICPIDFISPRCKEYRWESGMLLFKWKVTWNYAYSPFNMYTTVQYWTLWCIVLYICTDLYCTVLYCAYRWWEQYRNLPWPDKIALLNTALTVYEVKTYFQQLFLKYNENQKTVKQEDDI